MLSKVFGVVLQKVPKVYTVILTVYVHRPQRIETRPLVLSSISPDFDKLQLALFTLNFEKRARMPALFANLVIFGS